MQSVEIQGLDRVVKALEDMPGTLREARAQVMEEMGEELLGAVQQRIGGTGRIAGAQDYHVGSGKGYVAVRAKAKTDLGRYAAGYVTNALEGGHEIRKPANAGARSRAKLSRVPGKYMYRDTGELEAERLAETAAERIEQAAVQALEGES